MPSPQTLFFLLTLALCSLPLPAHQSHNSTRSDEGALLAFKNSLASDPFHSLRNWNANHSFCTWIGVICSSPPQPPLRVVSLNVTDMSLTGPISPFLGNLSFLRVLSLKNNSFYGHIPYELGGLSRLRILRLSRNELQEYGTGGKVWAKGDVYSYGILLLELLTRRRPIDDIFVEGMDLSKWVRVNFQRNIIDVVDSNLFTDVNESQSSRELECITQVLQVGLACVNESPEERPNMREIVKRLDTIKQMFLGMPRVFELPVDISSLLENTSIKNNTRQESDESWYTSIT